MSMPRFPAAPLAHAMSLSLSVTFPLTLALPISLPLTLACAAAVLPAPVLAQADDSAPAALVIVDLPAQPLASALNELARQARLQLMVHPDLVAGRTAPAVSGELTVRQALDHLLAGSGLSARVRGSEVIVQRPEPTSSGQPAALPAVVVSAAAVRDPTSEGSGRYAPRALSIGRTEQSLRETPQSVSVLSRQQMDDVGLTTLDQAVNYLTGLSTSGYGGHAAGFAGTVTVARGYEVSSLQDGLPVQNGESHDMALYDRIETMRGPVGLLQGNGEPGGAINYVMKRPQSTTQVNGLASFGSWGNRRLGVDLSGALNASGSLRGRAILLHSDRDAFYDVARSTSKTGYLALDYNLTPRTTISLAALVADRDSVNFWGLPLYDNGQVTRRRSAFVGLDRDASTRKRQVELSARHQFDSGWELSGRWLRNKSDYDGFGGYATSDVDPVTGLGDTSIGHIQTMNRNQSFDLHLTGPFEAWGRTHQVLVGYNRLSYEYLGGARYTSFTDVDVFNFHDYVIDEAIASKNNTETTQAGVYGTVRLKVSEPLTVVLGGRRSDYDNRRRSVAATTSAWVESAANTNGQFTPYGGLIWDLTKQLSVYASYADTFVPQTQVDASGNSIDPRTGWQFETGLKGEFLDGALNASLALFRIRDTNRAMVDLSQVGCGGTADGACYRAAGLVQSQGWEAEVVGRPLSNWDIAAGYSYVQARFLRDDDESLVGQRFSPQNTPRHLFKLWTHYRFDGQVLGGRLDGWSAGAGMRAQSDIVMGTNRQGGVAIYAAKVGYRFNRHLDAALMVNNLFDRHYLQAVGSTLFNLYGEPRSWMLSLRGGF